MGVLIEEVCIVGAGAIGRQIALQSAVAGYAVTLCDNNRRVLDHCLPLIDFALKRDFPRLDKASAQSARNRISIQSDLNSALQTADLLVESIPENLALKRDFFKHASKIAPPHTLFATNSSSFLPSMLIDSVDRPERFLALHFHLGIQSDNIIDVMGHLTTSLDTLDTLVDFVKSLNCIPIIMKKESGSYVYTYLYQGYIFNALTLWHEGVASIYDIDRSWMVVEQKPMGPFGLMDQVGLQTVHDILQGSNDLIGFESRQGLAEKLRKKYLALGKTGSAVGEGFYKYPNPLYESKSFIHEGVSK